MAEDPWEYRSVCRNLDPDLWFPAGYGPAHTKEIREAKAYCQICPVRSQCLEFNLRLEKGRGPDTRTGISGGMTPKERWRHSKERTAA